MIKLRDILTEDSAREDAKRQGLDYLGFGRYGKNGKVTHKSSNGKLAPVAKTPSSKTTVPSRAPGKSNQAAFRAANRAQAKLRDASRAKDPDYDEKADRRPSTGGGGGGGVDGGGESRSDVVGYDATDLGLGGARSVYRGELKPQFRGVAPNRPLTPRDYDTYDASMSRSSQSVASTPTGGDRPYTMPTFTSKKTGKTYAWKFDTPDDVAPALPGRSPDGGEWLDSMGKGLYGKNGVATHKDDGKKLTPLKK